MTSGSEDKLQGNTATLISAGRVRKAVSTSAAVIVLLSSLFVGARRSIQDLTAIFRDAARGAVPNGLWTRVEFVKRRVPRGSLIVYYMDQPESWELGVWKRSLYPDYLVIPVAGPALLSSTEFQALRYRYHIQYVLLASDSLPPGMIRDRVALPGYPGGPRLALAELEH